jgi:UDPglucose--hexose-1-phosphate uridylyltransferase
VKQGIIERDTQTERDLFDTKLMGCLMPRPSEVNKKFAAIEKEQGAAAAFDWFYDFCMKSTYIRAERIARNIAWNHESAYGSLEITINLSKPEKDPQEVARLRTLPQVGYPKCMLCPENVGYAGRLDFPARQTLRVIPMTLNGEQWYFQFSPYVYYNQHCIVLRREHIPMRITRETFVRLLEFEERVPHYFMGSNAGLPIVGGSILNHDHFQGGAWEMPMARAKTLTPLRQERFPGLGAEILRWPMSVLRLRHADRTVLAEAAIAAFRAWEGYSDAGLGIHAYSGDEPHNAVTPIARRRGNDYEMDIVLRNNRTDEAHRLGIFHVHDHLHHIKKENIGLIEVMGLFILPGRLASEFEGLAGILCGREPFDRAALSNPGHPLEKHLPWLEEMLGEYGGKVKDLGEAMGIIRRQCGEKCVQVLDDCGVFKDNDEGRKGFLKFLETAGYEPV